jgi:hypothetical protein
LEIPYWLLDIQSRGDNRRGKLTCRLIFSTTFSQKTGKHRR